MSQWLVREVDHTISGIKGGEKGGPRARSSRDTSLALNSLYLAGIGASSGLDEELEILISLITALPGQPTEHDLLEKVVDPLDSLGR